MSEQSKAAANSKDYDLDKGGINDIVEVPQKSDVVSVTSHDNSDRVFPYHGGF